MERLEKRMNYQWMNGAGDEDERGEGNSGNNMDARGEDRMRRLEVSYFTIEDPYGWIYSADRYFRINKSPRAKEDSCGCHLFRRVDP